MPYLNLVILGVEDGGPNAVERLNEEYRRWKETGDKNRGTQRFLVP